MTSADFGTLLKASMGLDAGSIGRSAIERAVRDRQLACHLRDRRAYWERARTSEAELQALIEAVVVPETWFFRDQEAFATLTRICQEQLPLIPTDRALRLLSLPASTGEEPYSMAMALLDAGVPANRFRIEGVDISVRALAEAERATYGKNSFRGNDLTFRERHFAAAADGYRLTDAVRAQVRFEQGNLMAAGLLPGVELYDAIFCRNLLIYFDRATQDRAVRVLTRLLMTTGVLFVAPSEAGLMLNHDFVSVTDPFAFAFRKADGTLPEPRPMGDRASGRLSPARPAAPPIRPPQAVHAAASEPVAGAQVPPPAGPLGDPSTELVEAARLADEGRFVEAAACCEEHLRQQGPSAEAFYLIGLVRDATGERADAASFYRKALYLDPNHYGTLVHFAFLVEQQGNRATAQALRKRARQLERRNAPQHE